MKYLLIKEKDGKTSSHEFESQGEVLRHLEAMWGYTDWQLVAIVRIP